MAPLAIMLRYNGYNTAACFWGGGVYENDYCIDDGEIPEAHYEDIYDGGGDDTAEEGATAYFVDSGDHGEALGARGLLVFVAADEGAQHAHLSGGSGEAFLLF